MQDYLHEQIPQHYFEVLPLDYKNLNYAVHAETIDFILTNPTHYVRLRHNEHISEAMASQVNIMDGKELHKFGGVIFTNADRDDIFTLQDIKDKKIASVSQGSLGGFQMQAYTLMKAGLSIPHLSMLWTDMPHDNAVQKVIHREADVGFVRTGVLERMIKDGEISPQQIKVINPNISSNFPLRLSTELYPEWPIAAMNHTNDHVIRLVTSALLSLEHGSNITRKMQIQGFTISEDYEPVRNILREMRLAPYKITPTYVREHIWADYRWYFFFGIFALGIIILVLIRGQILNKNLTKLTERLDDLNHIDGLTEIGNRRYFDEEYINGIEQANRMQSSLAILMIDIDFFKQYNDTYGHQAGDIALRKVAASLDCNLLRRTDRVYRYGGEEFVALLHNCDAENALRIAELIREQVLSLKLPHSESIVSDFITISIGISAGIPNDNNILEQADKALYYAKKDRNKSCLYKQKSEGAP